MKDVPPKPREEPEKMCSRGIVLVKPKLPVEMPVKLKSEYFIPYEAAI